MQLGNAEDAHSPDGWESHGDNARRDIGKIQVKTTVLKPPLLLAHETTEASLHPFHLNEIITYLRWLGSSDGSLSTAFRPVDSTCGRATNRLAALQLTCAESLNDNRETNNLWDVCALPHQRGPTAPTYALGRRLVALLP